MFIWLIRPPHRIARVTLIVFLASILAVTVVSATQEDIQNRQGWNIASQFVCGHSADSWLNWWGYHWWDGGDTTGELWWDPPDPNSGWIKFREGFTSVSGGTGNALVHHETGYLTGWWEEKGKHHATFFSGTKTSTSGFHACW